MAELQFNIGTDVYCTNEVCGTLNKVVFDPDSDRVAKIVVEVESGLLTPPERYVVPIEDVKRATEQGVRLSFSREALREQVKYEEGIIEQPEADQDYRIEHRRFWPGLYGIQVGEPSMTIPRLKIKKGISADKAPLGRGTLVHHHLEELGTLDHLLVEQETGKITHLVMKRHHTLGDYVVIPAAKVKEITENGVSIEVSEEELGQLPRYTPRKAEEIEAELKERLRLEATDYNLTHVRAEVDNGIVRLTGWVLDPEAKRYAEALVLSTPGVIDVEDEAQIGKET